MLAKAVIKSIAVCSPRNRTIINSWLLVIAHFSCHSLQHKARSTVDTTYFEPKFFAQIGIFEQPCLMCPSHAEEEKLVSKAYITLLFHSWLPRCLFDWIKSHQSLSYDENETACLYLQLLSEHQTFDLGNFTFHHSGSICVWNLRTETYFLTGSPREYIMLKTSRMTCFVVLNDGLSSSKMMVAHVAMQHVWLHGMCSLHPSCDQLYRV